MSKCLFIPKRPLRAIRRLIHDRRGAVAVMLAIALSGIIGFAGLGSEVAAWYFTTRAMQGAASSAAASAAAELAAATVAGSSITNDQLQHTGRAVSATFSFSNGVSSTTVSVNHQPNTTTGLDQTRCDSRLTAGGTSPYGCYVEVVIQQTQTRALSSLFMSSDPTITARAVALANTAAASTGCVVALDKHASRAMNAGGTGTLTFNSCALYANSDASDGIYVGGSGVVNAQAAYVVGNINGTVNTASGYGTYTGVNPITDPYAYVPSPSGYSTSGNCGYGTGSSQSLNKLFGTNNFNGPAAITENTTTNVTIINPTGCSMFGLGGNHDLHLTNTETLVLCPGTYVFDAANLIMDGQSTLLAPPTGSTLTTDCPGNTSGGVTIIFSSSTGGSPGIPSISAGSNVTLTAPTSGTYSGIALFGDRLTCSGNGNNDLNGSGQACAPSLVGGGTENITGAIYFPLETVTYGGGASAGGPQCTQIVANRISFSGGSTFNSNCQSTGGQTLNLTNGTLVM